MPSAADVRTVVILRFIGKAIVFVAVVAFLVGLMLHFHVATYSYLASALAGSLVIHLWARPRLRWLLAAGLLGVAFAAVYGVVSHGPVLGGWLAFLGLGSLASLTCAALWGTPSERQASLDTCLTASMFPLFLVVAGFSLAVTSVVYTNTYDLYLYAFDEQVGGQISFLAGRLFAHSGAIRQLCWLGYEGLPLAMAIAFAMERNRPGRRTSSIMTAFTVAAAGGFVLYNLYPAAGPVHVFGAQFPYLPPPAGSPPFRLVTPGAAPRNAMPSVHMAMALLIWWNSRVVPRVWRWMAGLLLILTILATLGFGEHFWADLFVAIPFALLAQAIASSGLPWTNMARLSAAGVGALLVAAWLAYLRLPSPFLYGYGPLAWVLLMLSGCLALCIEVGLDRAGVTIDVSGGNASFGEGLDYCADRARNGVHATQ